MEILYMDYKYSFRYNDCELNNYCIASKLFKGKTLFISKPKHNYNLKFNHPIKELIWAANYGARDNRK